MKSFRKRSLTLTLSAALALVILTPVEAADPKTIRVSKGRDGDADGLSSYVYRGGISGSGKLVAFESFADNLMPNDNDEAWDIFVYNRKTGSIKHVSRKRNGVRGNDEDEYPVISSDGRFVAFESESENLIPNDDNNASDILIHDRETKKLHRASVRSNGTEGNADSSDVAISGDGTWVVFLSAADNLVPNDDNAVTDVFAHNTKTGNTRRVSVSSEGDEANSESYEPTISDNGRFVAFDSQADNLVSGDQPNSGDVFIHNLKNGVTRRVSVKSNGDPADSSSEDGILSRTGRFIAFSSLAENLAPGDGSEEDIFVHDRVTGKTRWVSDRANGEEGNGPSKKPDISPSGRFVIFYSEANNLVPGADDTLTTDIYVRDRETGKTRLVSKKTNGDQANQDSYDPAISNDGRWAAFYSTGRFDGPESGESDGDVFLRGPLR